MINLELKENDIKNHTKDEFKLIVKSKINEATFKYLQNEKKEH